MDALGPPRNPWAVNSKPVLNRQGRPIHHPARQRVLLPVCTDCNRKLNNRFEKPAKPIIEALATNGWSGSFDETEWQTVGLWWAKVLLMLGHPKARVADNRLNDIAVRFDNAPPDYTWMINGNPPPSYLSLWVFRGAIIETDPEFMMILPNDVAMTDGTNALCHELSLVTEGLCATVVSHPGISIDHPLVQRQDSWELLHNPPKRGDLSNFATLAGKAVAWVQGGTVPEGHRVGPDEVSQLTALFGYESDDLTSE